MKYNKGHIAVDKNRSGDVLTPVAKHPQDLDLYGRWLVLNKPIYAKYCNIVAMVFMASLIPFDFILFNDPLVFLRFRLLLILGFALDLLLLESRGPVIHPKQQDHFEPLLLIPSLFFNFLYIYFLYMTHDNSYTPILIFNCMVIILSTLFLYRFWREQYTLNLVGILCILLVSAIRPEILKDCLLLVMLHLSCLMAAFFFRRDFMDSLSSRDVAEGLSVTDSGRKVYPNT